MKRFAVLVLILALWLPVLGCTQNTASQEKKDAPEARAAKTVEEQIQNNRSVIFKEYDNLKAFRAAYQNDLRTMNGLVDPKKYEIVLKNLEYEYPQAMEEDYSKVTATYKKIDKDKYVVKYYASPEESTALMEADLAALNASVADQGVSYKFTLEERLPGEDSVRVYFEKLT